MPACCIYDTLLYPGEIFSVFVKCILLIRYIRYPDFLCMASPVTPPGYRVSNNMYSTIIIHYCPTPKLLSLFFHSTQHVYALSAHHSYGSCARNFTPYFSAAFFIRVTFLSEGFQYKYFKSGILPITSESSAFIPG